MEGAFRKLLDVRPGELAAITPALLLAFATVAMQGLAMVAADTLFVTTFDLGDLSRFVVVSSVVRVVVAIAYGALGARARGPRADAVVIAAAAVTMLVSGAFAGSSSRALVYVVCVAQLLLPQLAPLVAMNAIMDCFHARQARRLLPLVAAAATVGTIAVGAIAKIVAPLVGAPSLLFFGAAFGAIALPLPKRVALVAREAAGPPSEVQGSRAPSILTTFAAAARDMRESRTVRLFVAGAFVTSAGTALVDYAFKASLKAHFARDEMAAFIGVLTVALNAAVLVAQLVLSSRFVARFGVAASLRALPVTLLVAGPAIAVAPSVAVVAGVKAAEGFLRYSLVGSVSSLLVTPLRASTRARASVFVRGIASPVGTMAAGVALSAFGHDGPSALAMGALVAIAGALGVVATWRARVAYMEALAQALGEGRLSLDVPADAAATMRKSLTTMLADAVRMGDDARATKIVLLMSDRLFDPSDLAPALSAASIGVRRAAVASALEMATNGARLLALVRPDDDDAVETSVLAKVRALGGAPDAQRIDRALARADRTDAPIAAHELWAEAMIARARAPEQQDGVLRSLRDAAASRDSPRRAFALRALAELRDTQASDIAMASLASQDARVFAEGACAAVTLAAPGAVPLLVAHLVTGPSFVAASRALSLAGPDAIPLLIAALPTTRSGGQTVRTAFASAHTMTGTLRAARVLAKLGPDACARMLASFAELGHQARRSIARALASVDDAVRATLPARDVLAAMDLVVEYSEQLAIAHRQSAPGMLRRELAHRIDDCIGCALDLATALGAHALIARARASLAGPARARGNALELLENALPPALAARTIALLEIDLASAGADSRARAASLASFDGWLAVCARFDRGELSSDDRMNGVIERILVLSDSSLFSGLSSEELYPVGEIAQPVTLAAGQLAVKQGDAGDALFVVASGTLRVTRNERTLKEIGRGSVFGEVALLDGAPRSASVAAVTDAELLRVSRADFEALLDERPEVARGIIRTLLGHLRQT